MAWFMAHSIRYYWSLSFTQGPSPSVPSADFPTIPSFHIRADLWCEAFSPSVTLKLVPAFSPHIGHLTCENNFCGAIVCSVVFKQSKRMGRGTPQLPHRQMPEKYKISGCLGIVVSSSFLGYSSPWVEETYFLTVVPGPKPRACLGQPRFWECCCVNTPWHVLAKLPVPSETLQCSEGYSKILLWSCSWGNNLQTGKA